MFSEWLEQFRFVDRGARIILPDNHSAALLLAVVSSDLTGAVPGGTAQRVAIGPRMADCLRPQSEEDSAAVEPALVVFSGGTAFNSIAGKFCESRTLRPRLIVSNLTPAADLQFLPGICQQVLSRGTLALRIN